ncbi:MAG: hypothetical protein WBQ19_19515 [Terriglobales bacterium]|jgi:Big-like domain-containing protein
MRSFLSRHGVKICFGEASQTVHQSMCALAARNLCPTLLVVCIVLLSPSFAQQPFLTSRFDSARDGANTNETLLTPTNVNKNSFGHLFSFPVDPGVAASPNADVMAQPLYMPNVNILGQGTLHNVVYVVTMADSVYAIDADTGAQLWYASMLNGGGTPATVSDKTLPCGLGNGFDEEGIIGTPVIDTTTNTMYLVAKTALNGTVRHHIHALDITSGNEQPGSPVQITNIQTTSNKGHVTVFNSLHQKNRPGLLLLNGVLYLGFGSNGCNDDNSGWVLSYNASAAMGSPEYLAPLAVFNTSPDWGLTSIWQAGTGLAADEAGNIFFETAEVAGAGHYDVPTGGQTYCNSVVKLYPDLTVYDYFTPWTVAYLNTNDLDLSSTGVLILPDQDDSPTPHELVASGKQGWVYVLDRDSLGMYAPGGPTDPQVIQEFPLLEKSANPENDYNVQFGSAAYWNETVYFAPDASPVLAYPVSGGELGTPGMTAQKYSGSHSPSISANGNTNGIVWVISGSELLAFNACTASAPSGTCQNQYAPLELLYSTIQAPDKRDALPPVGHFVTQTVADGKLFVATQTSLEAYGLFPVVTVTLGSAQTATVGTALPNPIQVQVASPYNGQPDVGATVNFSDGGKGGVFSPSSGPGTGSVTTNANGNASITYTVPQKSGTYTLTMSGTGFGTATTTATAAAAAAVKIISYGGGKQTGTEGSILPNPIVAQVQDTYKNGVPGVTINFTANNGGVPNPSSVVTNAKGLARTTLQLPAAVATVTVTASSAGFKSVTFVEYSVAPAASAGSVTINSTAKGVNPAVFAESVQ